MTLRSGAVARLLLVWAMLPLVAHGTVDAASPVNRVVNLLRMMSSRLSDRSDKEAKFFDKFQCYCATNVDSLRKSIAIGNDKIPQLGAVMKETEAAISQLANDVAGHKSDRDAAVKAMNEQQALRKSDRQAFVKESTELKANIGSLQRAIGALEKSQKKKEDASLVQSSPAALLQQIGTTINADLLRAEDRQMLANMLQTADETGLQDVPEILGMLKQMLDDMQDDLKTMVNEETAGQASYEALMQAKRREQSALTTAIEEKQSRHSSLKVDLVRMKSDMDNTKTGVTTDSKLLDKLSRECAQRREDYAVMKKAMTEEMAALADATKLLTDDDAVATFNAVDRPASFVQLRSRSRLRSRMRRSKRGVREAVDMLSRMSKQHPEQPALGLLAAQAATAGKQPKNGLAKIAKLIDDMLVAIQKEQQDDVLQKQMCEAELRREGDHQSKVESAIDARGADIANVQEQLASMAKDMDALRESIRSLDKSVAEATAERKEAHAISVKLLAENHAAVELLQKARDRLDDYYSQAATALNQERAGGADSEVQEFGFLTDDGSRGRVTTSLNKQSAGIMKMIALIQDDLKKESVAAKAQEVKDQAEYESLMKASSAKRDQDAKALTQRAAARAGLHETQRMLTKKKKVLLTDLEQTKTVIANLHKQCDWNLKNFDARQAARKAEAEALKRTKAVLAGADYSLGQARAKPLAVSQHS